MKVSTVIPVVVAALGAEVALAAPVVPDFNVSYAYYSS